MAIGVVGIVPIAGVAVEQAQHAGERRLSRGRADVRFDPGGVLELEVIPGDVRGPVGAVADRARRRHRLARACPGPRPWSMVSLGRTDHRGRRRGVSSERTSRGSTKATGRPTPTRTAAAASRPLAAALFENRDVLDMTSLGCGCDVGSEPAHAASMVCSRGLPCLRRSTSDVDGDRPRQEARIAGAVGGVRHDACAGPWRAPA